MAAQARAACTTRAAPATTTHRTLCRRSPSSRRSTASTSLSALRSSVAASTRRG